MINATSDKRKVIGFLLKTGVILSCSFGIALHLIADTSGFMSRIFLAFTIQSNMWIAGICLIHLLISLLLKNFKIPGWLHIIKFMFTVSILLTYIVFAVLLTPLMEWSYLTSLSNILLHTVTAVLATLDFIADGYVYVIKKRMLYLQSLIMPLLYSIFFFVYYEITNQMPVPYFFMDFKKYGWFNISSFGIGVIYWMVILCAVLILISHIILKLKKKSSVSKRTVICTVIVMLLASISFSIINLAV